MISIPTLIKRHALHYGVDPSYALRIAELESDMKPYALGDNEAAVGLYQWHRDSWVCACNARGWDPRVRSRWCVPENIELACWALGQGWDGWWSTSEEARE